MRFSNIKIITNPVLFYFVMLNFLRPACIIDLAPESLVRIINLWDKYFGIPVFALCIIYLFVYRINLCSDVLIYYLYKIIGTILVTFFAVGTITGGGSFRHLWTISAILFVSLLLKIDFSKTLNRLTYLFSILVFVNFATILLFPGGMYFYVNYENYFLGYDNGHAVVFMPALFFAFEYAYRTKRYVLPAFVWVSVFLSAFICKSGTTLIGIFVLIVLLVLLNFRLIRKYLFNWKIVSVLIVAAFLLIVIFRIQNNLSDIIMQLFGKDVTFTGRTVLWDRAISYFKENPLFGVGDNNEVNIERFQLNSQRLSYSHNEILDIIVRSGLVGLVLYVTVIIRTFKALRGKWSFQYKIWLVIIVSYWVMMFAESYSNYRIYFMYFVLMLFPRIENQNSSKVVFSRL